MRRLLALVSLLLVGALVFCAPGLTQASQVTLIAVNVGKADCLILHHQGQSYMIDTGTVQSVGRIRACLEAVGLSHFDGIFVTHSDKDHYGGLAALLAGGVTCDALYASPMTSENSHALAGYEVNWLEAGDRVEVKDQVYFEVIGPLTADLDEENNNSLVMVFHSPWGRVLLGGDMQREEEKALLEAGLIPACDVMKVPYHGGDKGTSQALVDAVRPKVALISTNTPERESTPSPQVVARLQKAGAKVLVTQEAQALWVTLPDLAADPVSFTTVPQQVEPVKMSRMDTENEIITLQNSGSAATSLKGWYVYSDRGDECYFFPDEAAIPAGGAVTLGTRTTEQRTDYVWPEKNVIHNKKDDTLTLYDPWGRAASLMGNGK